MTSTFLLSLASCMVIPYYALIMDKQLHVPIFYIGCILGIANFLQFGFSIFGTNFQNYCGNYYSLAFSLIIRLLGFLLIATFHSYLTILGIFISSIGAALYFPIAKCLIVEYSDKSRILINIAVFNSLLTSGMLLGPAVGAAMLYYQQNRLILYSSSILLAILVIANLFFLKKMKSHKKPHTQVDKVSLTPEVQLLLVLQAVFVLLFIGYQNFIALYLAKTNLSLYPIVAASTCIVGICQPFFVSKIKQLNQLHIMFLSFFCLACSFLIFAAIGSLYFLFAYVFIAAALATIAEIALFLKIDCTVSDLYKNHVTYIFGLSRFICGLGLLIGNLGAGFIYGLFKANVHYYWVTMGVITLLVSIVLLLALKTRMYNMRYIAC